MTKNIDLMNETFDDVADDVLLENGIYDFRITNYEVGKQKNEKETPFCQLVLRPVGVVESDSLSEEDLPNVKPVYHKMWLSEGAKKMAKRFFTDILGVDTEGESYASLFEGMVGQEVRAKVTKHPPKNEGGKPWVEVDRFFPAR